MSILPPGWAKSTVGELVDVAPKNECGDSTMVGFVPMNRMGKRFREIPTFEPRPWREVKKGYTHFADGDVLIARITPCFENGKAGIPRNLPNGIGAGSTEFVVLRPKVGVIASELVLAVAKSADFLQECARSMTGAVGQQRVPKAQILFFPISVPPFDEQKRIVAKLDSLLAKADSCRERLDRVPQILKKFREAVLEAAVSGKLTEEWRSVNSSAQSAEELLKQRESSRAGRLRVRGQGAAVANLDLPELPTNWAWIPNHRLAADSESAICAGPFGTIFKAKDFRPQGVPIIFLRHVAAGQYLTTKPGYMDESVWRDNHQPYSIFGGELLVTKLGDPPGTACIYPEGQGVAMVTPDVMKMTVDQAVALPRYLMYFFNSRVSKGITRQLAFGVTRLRIDLSMFKHFPIPLPPLEEQIEVVRRVAELLGLADALEKQYRAATSQIGHLTPSVLAKGFRGELVPQDPHDEPAEKLLERVRAQSGKSADPVDAVRSRNRSTRRSAATIEMGGRADRKRAS